MAIVEARGMSEFPEGVGKEGKKYGRDWLIHVVNNSYRIVEEGCGRKKREGLLKSKKEKSEMGPTPGFWDTTEAKWAQEWLSVWNASERLKIIELNIIESSNNLDNFGLSKTNLYG